MLEQEMVEEFHVKNGFPIDRLLTNWKNRLLGVSPALEYIFEKLKIQVGTLKDSSNKAQIYGDERLYRVYLMLEELTEVIEALASGNEIELADGLGDLMYVVLGTAVTYNIPMKEVFEEIHLSNMAKKKRTKDNPRMRDKGEGWKRPDIKGAIERGRNEDKG